MFAIISSSITFMCIPTFFCFIFFQAVFEYWVISFLFPVYVLPLFVLVSGWCLFFLLVLTAWWKTFDRFHVVSQVNVASLSSCKCLWQKAANPSLFLLFVGFLMWQVKASIIANLKFNSSWYFFFPYIPPLAFLPKLFAAFAVFFNVLERYLVRCPIFEY